MDIVENLDAWGETYESGWLADLQTSGTPNYKIYQRAKNSAAPSAKPFPPSGKPSAGRRLTAFCWFPPDRSAFSPWD